MNIQILDSHLREFLETKARPEKIAQCLSLCGPSVDHLTKYKNDWLYDIEITTNRVDTASVMGIAREAAAILPQFGIKARYKKYEIGNMKFSGKPVSLKLKPDLKLNRRVMAVVLEVEQKSTPKWMIDILEAAGMRSKNILVDITNFVMLEVGHPTHVFDCDKIKSHTLKFRLSKKGEKATSFDNKTHILPGNDIIITGVDNEIIDLPGIIGTKNSVVSDTTKQIIFFIDNNDPTLMRKTSLALGIRTMAVQLNEKSVDPELGVLALNRAVDLYQKLANAKIVSGIYDFYPNPYKPKQLLTSFSFINQKVGIDIDKKLIMNILTNLGFKVSTKANKLEVWVPSFRAEDIDIPEDLVEEIARIYGYYKLPSTIMMGQIPLEQTSTKFAFENLVKDYLRGLGAIEIYTLSLVSQSMAGKDALQLKNPLGEDTKYMRTRLVPSLQQAAATNSKHDKFHLFEMSNIYIASKGLPDENMKLAGIFKGYSFREAKGTIEALFQSLNINLEVKLEKSDTNWVYEFDIEQLFLHYKPYKPFTPPAKFPPQIEDITMLLNQETKIGELIQFAKEQKNVVNAELVDIFQSAFTFRIYYQDTNKTMTDKEVEKVRERLIKNLSNKFSATLKI